MGKEKNTLLDTYMSKNLCQKSKKIKLLHTVKKNENTIKICKNGKKVIKILRKVKKVIENNRRTKH